MEKKKLTITFDDNAPIVPIESHTEKPMYGSEIPPMGRKILSTKETDELRERLKKAGLAVD